MSEHYRRVEIDSDGNSAEPVNFVGVHPLRWNSDRTIQGNTPPDAGFVETEGYEREFVEWWMFGSHPFIAWYDEHGKKYITDEVETEMTLDELHEYWETEIKSTKANESLK